MDEMPSPPQELTVTGACAKRVGEIIAQEGDDSMMLRIAISGGGCSGFQYGFDLDNTINGDDKIFEKDGVKVVVDLMSLGMLMGSEVDYVDDLMGAAFRINNPNIASSCGCGVSFAI